MSCRSGARERDLVDVVMEFTSQVNEASTSATAAPSGVRAAAGEHTDQPTDVPSIDTVEREATLPGRGGEDQNLDDEEVDVPGPTET